MAFVEKGTDAHRSYMFEKLQLDLRALRDHEWLSEKTWLTISELLRQESIAEKDVGDRHSSVSTVGATTARAGLVSASSPSPAQRTPTSTRANGVQKTRPVKAKALYDNDAEETDDLFFRAGDIVTNFSKVNDEWGEGDCRGAHGIFPLAYVEVISPPSRPEVPARPSLPPQIAKRSPHVPPKKSPQVPPKSFTLPQPSPGRRREAWNVSKNGHPDPVSLTREANGDSDPTDSSSCSSNSINSDSAGTFVFAENMFTEVDEHAVQAPQSMTTSVASLASYLFPPSFTPLQRVRSAFVWIAQFIAYDVDLFMKYSSGADVSADAEEVLRSRKAICSGYSQLFGALMRKAGVKAIEVNGYSKGGGYYPGKTFSGRTDHAWNVVQLDGLWYLIDCCWGAGYVNGLQFHRCLNNTYFLTPPKLFITDHYPLEKRWQLLKCLQTVAEFSQSLKLTEMAKFGVTPQSHSNCVIESDNSVLQIVVNNPQQVSFLVQLHRMPAEIRAQAIDLPSGAIVPNSVLVETAGDETIISVTVPEQGKYFLMVNASPAISADKYMSNERFEFTTCFSYMLDMATPTQQFDGFPLMAMAVMPFTKFKLHAPRSQAVPRQRCVKFHVSLPGAAQVFVVTGHSEFVSLRKQFSGDWIGSADTRHSTEVHLAFSMLPPTAFGAVSWTHLLTYKVA